MKRCLAFVGAVAFVAACGSSSGDDPPASGSGGSGARGGTGAEGGTTASGGTGGSTGGTAGSGSSTNGNAGDTSEAGVGPDDGGSPGTGGSTAGSGPSAGGAGGSTGGSEPNAGAGNEAGAGDFCLVGEEPGAITSFDTPHETGTTADGAAWELGYSMTADDVSAGVDGPGRGADGYAAFIRSEASEQRSGSLHVEFATMHGCYDAAALSGLSFYAKGDVGDGTAQVIVHTFVDAYTTYFDVPAAWEKRTVSFADFTTGEEYEPWDPTRITEIEFAVSGGPLELWVDDLSWR